MNFIINNIFLIVIVLGAMFLLLLPLIQGRGPQITPYHITKKMNEGRIVIVDVSKQAEFDAGHLRNAIHIPIEELKDRLSRIDRYKAESVVVVCATGPRAGRATSILKKAGFKDVSSLEGGMKDWKSQKMPIEVTDQEQPLKSKTKGRSKA